MKILKLIFIVTFTFLSVVGFAQKSNNTISKIAISDNFASTIKFADSVYQLAQWQPAIAYYTKALTDTASNNAAGQIWNRMGYANQNLGNYIEALKNYNEVFNHNPPPIIRGSATGRMARVYSLMNNTGEAATWAVKAAATGYNILPDMDSLADFKNLRLATNYAETRKKVNDIIYPCSAEPHAHDFDFWIGEWDTFRTGTQLLSGHSSVQVMAGGCAILENFTSLNAYSGKSFNYYDAKAGKWEQDWLGSGGQADRQRYYNGEYKDGIMQFTYEGVNTKGEKITGNFRFYNIDKNTVRQYQDASTDGGKTFTVITDITYTRRTQG